MFFKKKTSYSALATSFTIGAVAGAIVALFFAPMTGKKFQKKVVDVTEKVIETVDDLQQSVRKFANA